MHTINCVAIIFVIRTAPFYFFIAYIRITITTQRTGTP
eukprot:UN23439